MKSKFQKTTIRILKLQHTYLKSAAAKIGVSLSGLIIAAAMKYVSEKKKGRDW